jgi:hypothetical protein
MRLRILETPFSEIGHLRLIPCIFSKSDYDIDR